jgi:hypothetical protein
MQRTIEIADFDPPRGPVTIAQLMAMERSAWEHLRAEINLRRTREPGRPLARCRLCEGSVYIKAQAVPGGHMPLFAHHADAAAAGCPWYNGGHVIPDDARAAQYRGHQECALHRWMCEAIAQFLSRDPRCRKVTVDRYLKPAIEDRGRYPDVFAELDRLGKFAFEVQLSKPFAFEIAARHRHYQAEGVSLIWVFRDLVSELPQGFRDVIAFQRGNAFLFDEAAFDASTRAGALRLSALLESERGWLAPRIVGLDDLDRSSGRSVFLEDRRTARLLDHCQRARAVWWDALKEGRSFDFDEPQVEQRFATAWDSIRTHVPALSAWKEAMWRDHFTRARPIFLELAAMLFSIARSASLGDEHVYVTRYRGEGRLVAMLNARLSNATYMPYADLLEAMLAATTARPWLARTSLQTALARARGEADQVEPGHPVWNAAARLFPEVLDGLVRAELIDLDRLPEWTAPASAADRRAA